MNLLLEIFFEWYWISVQAFLVFSLMIFFDTELGILMGKTANETFQFCSVANLIGKFSVQLYVEFQKKIPISGSL